MPGHLASTTTNPVMSVVVPLHDEEETIGELHRRLANALEASGVSYEIVLVDDGSSDATGDLIDELEREDDHLVVVHLSRNFGHQAAVSAGLGVSILPEVAILPDHRVIETTEGFPSITDTEIALVAATGASPATRRLAEILTDFCSTTDPRKAA